MKVKKQGLLRLLGVFLVLMMLVNTTVVQPMSAYAAGNVGQEQTEGLPDETGSLPEEVPEAGEGLAGDPSIIDTTIDTTLDAGHSPAFTGGYAVLLVDTKLYMKADLLEANESVPEGLVLVVSSRVVRTAEEADVLLAYADTDKGWMSGYVRADEIRPMDAAEIKAYEAAATESGRDVTRMTFADVEYMLDLVLLNPTGEESGAKMPSYSDTLEDYDPSGITGGAGKTAGTEGPDDAGTSEGGDDTTIEETGDGAKGTGTESDSNDLVTGILGGGTTDTAGDAARTNATLQTIDDDDIPLFGGDTARVTTASQGLALNLADNQALCDLFSLTFQRDTQAAVLAGGRVTYEASIGFVQGKGPQDIIELLGAEQDTELTLFGVAVSVVFPEQMTVDAAVLALDGVTAEGNTVTFRFDEAVLGENWGGQRVALWAKLDNGSIPNGTELTASAVFTQAVDGTSSSLTEELNAGVTVNAQMKWQVVHGRTGVEVPISDIQTRVLNIDMSQAFIHVLEQQTLGESEMLGLLNVGYVEETFAIALGENISFEDADKVPDPKDLVELAFDTKLATGQYEATYDVQRDEHDPNHVIHVTVRVTASEGVTLPMVEVRAATKHIVVSELPTEEGKDRTDVTLTILEAKTAPVGGVPETDAVAITIGKDDLSSSILIYRGDEIPSGGDGDLVIDGENKVSVVLSRISGNAVTLGTPYQFKLALSRTTSNANTETMHDVRIRVYVPVDQPYTFKDTELVGITMEHSGQVTETIEGKAYAWIDFTISEITFTGTMVVEMPFGLEFPIGTTSAREAEQGLLVKVWQKQLDESETLDYVDVTALVKPTTSSIPKIDAQLSFDRVAPYGTYMEAAGEGQPDVIIDVPGSVVYPDEYATDPSAAFAASFANLMHGKANRIDAKSVQIVMEAVFPEDLMPTDAQLAHYLTTYTAGALTDGTQAASAISVEAGSDDNTRRITWTITPGEGKSRFEDFNSLILSELYPKNMDISHFGITGEEETALSGLVHLRLVAGEVVGADTDETRYELVISPAEGGAALEKTYALRKSRMDVSSALVIGKSTSHAGKVVTATDKITYRLEGFGTEGLEEDGVVYNYTLHDSWRTAEGAANPAQRIALSGANAIVVPALTEHGQATSKYSYTVEFEVLTADGGTEWVPAGGVYSGAGRNVLTLPSVDRLSDIVGIAINFAEASGEMPANGIGNRVRQGMGISGPIEMTFSVLAGESDPQEAGYPGDPQIENEAWISLDYALTADAFDNGTAVTEVTPADGRGRVELEYVNPSLVASTNEGYKTVVNGNTAANTDAGDALALLRGKLEPSKRFYPGDWVDFTITVPFSAFAEKNATLENVRYVRLIESPGMNMGSGSMQIFPALLEAFPPAGEQNDDIYWTFGCYDEDGNALNTTLTTETAGYANGKIQLDLALEDGERAFEEGDYVQLVLSLRIGDLSYLRAAYPEAGFAMYTPLQFQNTFRMHAYEEDPAEGGDSVSVGGGAGVGDDEYQPEDVVLGLAQRTLDGLDEMTSAGTPLAEVDFEITLTARQAEALATNLAVYIPQHLRFESVVSLQHTIRERGDQTVDIELNEEDIVLREDQVVYIAKPVTVSEGDQVVLVIRCSFPDAQTMIEYDTAVGGYAKYTPVSAVLAPSAKGLLQAAWGTLGHDKGDWNGNSDISEGRITASSDAYAKTPVLAPNITKEASGLYNGYIHTGDSVTYTVTLQSTPTNNANADMPVYGLVDELPDGFVYRAGSARVLDDETAVVLSGSQHGNWVTFTIENGADAYLTVPAGGEVRIEYVVDVPGDLFMDDVVDREAVNTVYALLRSADYTQINTAHLRGEGKGFLTEGELADVDGADAFPADCAVYAQVGNPLVRMGIKPGLSKSMRARGMSATPGGLMDITLTFANGPSAGRANGEAVMKNPTLVDILPPGWTLQEGAPTFVDPEAAAADGIAIGSYTPSADKSSITISITGDIKPGKSYAVTFRAATPHGVYGTAYNDAYMRLSDTLDQYFDSIDVVMGQYDLYQGSAAVHAQASLDIQGEMSMEVTKVANAPYGSDTWIAEGTGNVLAGMEVAYKLRFANTHADDDGYTYGSICLIDRLPGEEDTMTTRAQARGSKWALEAVRATVTDGGGSTSSKIEYAAIADASSLTDADWRGENASAWHDSWQAGDTMMRVTFNDGFTLTHGNAIEVLVTAKVPQDAQNALGGLAAYNSFGYSALAKKGESQYALRYESAVVGLRIVDNSISGVIWYDEDGDGMIGEGEQRMPEGMPVYLSTSKDSIEGAIVTRTTGDRGEYRFENVMPGVYYVLALMDEIEGGSPYLLYTVTTRGVGEAEVSSNFVKEISIAGGASDTGRLGMSAPLTISQNRHIENLNAGLVARVPEIGDTVWLDINGDGYQDQTEPGVAGVTVTLYETSEAGEPVVATRPVRGADGSMANVPFVTTTDESGKYLFTGMAVGKLYRVAFSFDTAEMEYDFVKVIHAHPDKNSKVRTVRYSAAGELTGWTDLFAMPDAQGQYIGHSIDAGLVEAPPYRIEGRVWFDANEDGVYDEGEQPITTSGLTVRVVEVDAQNNPVEGGFTGSAEVDAGGGYRFVVAPEILYRLEFELPDGTRWAFATAEKAADDFDAAYVRDTDAPRYNFAGVQADNAVLAQAPDRVRLTAERQVAWLDIGLYNGASVQGTVWHDKDRDGQMDPGNEEGFAGVEVLLRTLLGKEYATVTAEDGTYRFAGVPTQVQYYLVFTMPDGHKVTTGYEGYAPLAVSATDAPQTVLGNHAYESMAGTGQVEKFDVLLNHGIYVANMGLYTPMHIAGTVWYDHDGDGVIDPDESPMVNYPVYLVTEEELGGRNWNDLTPEEKAAVLAGLDADQVTATDGNGEYIFPNLEPGKYVVVVTTPEYVFTTHDEDRTGPVAGNGETPDLGAVYEVTLEQGEMARDRDFGLVELCMIWGIVFEDSNYNSRWDEGELRLEGVTVHLYRQGDADPLAVAYTDSTGYYEFTDLHPGSYRVHIDKTTHANRMRTMALTAESDDDDSKTYDDYTKEGEPEEGVIVSMVSGEGFSRYHSVTSAPQGPRSVGIFGGLADGVELIVQLWYDANGNNTMDAISDGPVQAGWLSNPVKVELWQLKDVTADQSVDANWELVDNIVTITDVVATQAVPGNVDGEFYSVNDKGEIVLSLSAGIYRVVYDFGNANGIGAQWDVVLATAQDSAADGQVRSVAGSRAVTYSVDVTTMTSEDDVPMLKAPITLAQKEHQKEYEDPEVSADWITSDDDYYFRAGAVVTYAITLHNTTAALQTYSIRDAIDPMSILVKDSVEIRTDKDAAGTIKAYDYTDGVLTVDDIEVGVGATAYVVFQVKLRGLANGVESPGIWHVHNSAIIETEGVTSGPPVSTNDTVVQVVEPVVTVKKEVVSSPEGGGTHYKVGEDVEFLITLTVGDTQLNDIDPDLNTIDRLTLREVLPSGMTFISMTPVLPAPGADLVGSATKMGDDWVIELQIGSANGVYTWKIIAKADEPTDDAYDWDQSNGVQVIYQRIDETGETNPNATLDDEVEIDVGRPNVSILKAASKSSVALGETFIYTFTITNTGPVGATVAFEDAIDSRLDIVSTLPADMTRDVQDDGSTLVSSKADIVLGAAGTAEAVKTLTITVTPTLPVPTPEGGTWKVPNAAVIYVDGGDKEPSNTVEVDVNANYVLEISKTAPQNTYKPGDTVTYTVVVTNNGLRTLTGIVVRDTVSTSGVTASVDRNRLPSGATVNSDGSVTIASLAPGNSTTLIFVSVVPTGFSGDINNTVTGKATETNEVSDVEKVNVIQVPAISVTKVADRASGRYLPGEWVTYTIVVTNTGNVDLKNVKVEDKLAGGTWVIPSGQTGNITTNADNTLTINALPVKNASGTVGVISLGYRYQVPTTTTMGTTIDNVVVVTGDTEERVTAVTDTDDVIITVNTNPALTITKTVAKTSYQRGETAVFTVTVTNTGNVTLYNVLVDDPLTGGTFVLPTNARELGMVLRASGRVLIESMAPGATVSLPYHYQVPSTAQIGSTLTNTATVVGYEDATSTTGGVTGTATISAQIYSSSTPATGDETPLGWIIGGLAAAAVLIVVAVIGIRRSKRK